MVERLLKHQMVVVPTNNTPMGVVRIFEEWTTLYDNKTRKLLCGKNSRPSLNLMEAIPFKLHRHFSQALFDS